jgi:hypothetical protein
VSFTGDWIDPAIVHPWLPNFNRTGTRFDLTRRGVPVSHDNSMPIGINFTSMGLDVRFNLDVQRGSKHSACPLMNEIIKDRLRVLASGIVLDYLQHWRAFLAGTAIPDVLQWVRRRVRRATKPKTSSTSFDHNSLGWAV